SAASRRPTPGADNCPYPNTRKEPGNRRWDLLRVHGDADRFILDEIYIDENAFKAHQQTEHYHRWRAVVADMMAEPRRADKADVIYPR
ncbi:MAG: putative quinol monooxygenase, partial [Planctomycetota bacterium]